MKKNIKSNVNLKLPYIKRMETKNKLSFQEDVKSPLLYQENVMDKNNEGSELIQELGIYNEMRAKKNSKNGRKVQINCTPQVMKIKPIKSNF